MKRSNSGIYCYLNTINGKRYVGQSQDMQNRKRQHEMNFKREYDKTSPLENIGLWNAVKSYGRQVFEYQILEECSVEFLDVREEFYIRSLNSHWTENGYNIGWGGKTCRGIVPSLEARQNMSKSHLGKKHTEDQKKRIGNAHVGLKYENPSSKYIGVYRRSRFGRSKKSYWMMDVGRKEGIRCCKACDTEVEAARAYNEWVLSHNLDRPLNVLP